MRVFDEEDDVIGAGPDDATSDPEQELQGRAAAEKPHQASQAGTGSG